MTHTSHAFARSTAARWPAPLACAVGPHTFTSTRRFRYRWTTTLDSLDDAGTNFRILVDCGHRLEYFEFSQPFSLDTLVPTPQPTPAGQHSTNVTAVPTGAPTSLPTAGDCTLLDELSPRPGPYSLADVAAGIEIGTEGAYLEGWVNRGFRAASGSYPIPDPDGCQQVMTDECYAQMTIVVPSKCYYFGADFVTYDKCRAECDALGANMPW